MYNRDGIFLRGGRFRIGKGQSGPTFSFLPTIIWQYFLAFQPGRALPSASDPAVRYGGLFDHVLLNLEMCN
jgi:hypothetical protein